MNKSGEEKKEVMPDDSDLVTWHNFKLKKDTADIFDHIRDNFENFAFGSIIGAFIADSVGSRVEFIQKQVSEEELDECFQMPGGGPHKVGPGQITDDSEMAISLIWGLTRLNKVSG